MRDVLTDQGRLTAEYQHALEGRRTAREALRLANELVELWDAEVAKTWAALNPDEQEEA